MKGIKISLAILLVSLTSVCCGTIPLLADIQDQYADTFPRESILKLEHRVVIEICTVIEGKEQCFEKTGVFTGTGSVIYNDPSFSAVLTAAHVCKFELPDNIPPGFTVKLKAMQLTGVDIYENRHDLKYIVSEKAADQCIVISTKPTNLKALKFSKTTPRPGDRVYTLGYPLGVYNKNVVWIGEGFYLGEVSGIKAAYNLLARGGSSGSPILNARGELIGILCSGYVNLMSYTFSPTYGALQSFLVRSLGIR